MNITYLIGAGASYSALPLVKDFKIRGDENPIKKFIKLLDKEIKLNDSAIHPMAQLINDSRLHITIGEIKKQLIENLEKLYELSIHHSTVDTYAKKLFLSGSDFTKRAELREFKFTLSAFFTAIQIIKEADERYDTFFASIAEKSASGKMELPPNIKIISWNYDFQFEKSFSPFYSDFNLLGTQSVLKAYPSVGDSIIGKFNEEYLKHFCMIKLNGTAGVFMSNSRGGEFHSGEYFGTNSDSSGKNKKITLEIALESILIAYAWSKLTDVRPLLSFAWEQEEPRLNQVEAAKKIAALTDILVIIGYSFPFFNRKIDKGILDSLLQAGKPIQRIYYQVHPNDKDYLFQRIEAILGAANAKNLVEMRDDIQDFFIPPQFTV